MALPVKSEDLGNPKRRRCPLLQMKQKITDFELDDESHWRAILECGHRQHVRHNPPLTSRSWVLTEEGRSSRIGFELDCQLCEAESDSLQVDD
ncbi:MAG TPA: DUF3565 domain-containing protein [Pyrinomonadaceae bacterium]|nr:DUF3565 domain-containing protein [Pyrinomonadaceae bacterium]